MALPAIIELGLNEAGTAIAVIVHPERGGEATIDYVNRPFAAVMRRLPADLAGVPFQAILDLVGKAECRAQLLQSLQSGAAVQLDVPLVAGGAKSWLGLRLSFPPPAASGLRSAVLIGRDITAARKSATQEDKMRQMLAQIFMRINAPVTIVGRNGDIVMCNAAFSQLTGFSAEEAKRLRVQDLTPPDLADASVKAREAQFAGGECYEMDFETLVKGGHRVAVRLTSVLLSSSDHEYRVVTLIPRRRADDAGPAEAGRLHAARDRGELRAISLEALRALFGRDWDRIAFRAMLRAEQAIRKRLGREDVLSRLDDSNFALWFSSHDSARNELALEAIVRDVRLTFLTEFGEEMSAYVSAKLVPGAALPPAGAGKPRQVNPWYEASQADG